MNTKNIFFDGPASGDGWIDLTVAIRHEMVHYPGDPAVELRQTKHLERGDPATVSRLSLGVHTGTHVDAPVHFMVGAAGIDRVPLDRLIGPARVLDLGDIDRIQPAHLDSVEIRPGDRILFKTGNSGR